MASKRMRSVARQDSGSDSSDVTDYFVSPASVKRQKRVGRRPDSEAPIPSRSGTARVSRGVAWRILQSPTRRVSVDREDDGDDASFNVDFARVASSANEALRGQKQTVNGLHAKHARGNRYNASSRRDAQEDEQAEMEGATTKPKQDARRRGRPSKPTTRDFENVARGKERSPFGNRAVAERVDPYEFVPSPARKSPSWRRTDARGGPPIEIQQQGNISLMPNTADLNHDQEEDVDSFSGATGQDEIISEDESEEQLADDEAPADDSAFVDAPQRGEESITTTITLKSFSSILRTLEHPAWTNSRNWVELFSMDDDSDQKSRMKRCQSAVGRKLLGLIMELKTQLEDAIGLQSEDGTDSAFDRTAKFLRDNSSKFQSTFGRINKTIEVICTDKLVSATWGEQLAPGALKPRRWLLEDISRRLIPIFILTTDQACGLGPSEQTQSSTHIEFNTFTLQIFLRLLGWTRRLEGALTRGLEQWPFEAEFIEDEGDLDEREVNLRSEKERARKTFALQLSDLHQAARKTESQIQNEVKKARRKRLDAALRQQKNVRDSEAEAEAKREREEEDERRKKTQQYEDFCRFTQSLKYAPDPWQHKWNKAMASSYSQGKHRSRVNSADGNLRKDDGFHVFDQDDESDPFGGSPPRERADVMDHQQDNQQKVVSVSEDSNRHAGQAGEPDAVDEFASGPIGGNSTLRSRGTSHFQEPGTSDWSDRERMIVIKAIRYDKTRDVASVASRLGRSEDEVVKEMARLKQRYRDSYHRRGKSIPEWAW